jgi:hypothetical protein
MKKISKDPGVCLTSKDGINYIDRWRKAPLSEIKFSTLQDLIERVEQARKEKLKKAS